jgi:hypothetical protein
MHLILEFFGGPRDGEVLSGGSRCLQIDEIQRQCDQCQDGVIGQRINCATLYAETVLETCSDSAIKDFAELGCRFPNHIYEVFARRDVGSEIRLGLKHINATTDAPQCRSCPLREVDSPKR